MFNAFDSSGFIAEYPDVKIPDFIISQALRETPDCIKDAIHEQCFPHQNVEDLEHEEQMNAVVMNAICWLMHQMVEEEGVSDWLGVLRAYKMPPSYANLINNLRVMADTQRGDEDDDIISVDELNQMLME